MNPSTAAARTTRAPSSRVGEVGISSSPAPELSSARATPRRKITAASSSKANGNRSVKIRPSAPARPVRSRRAAGSGPA